MVPTSSVELNRPAEERSFAAVGAVNMIQRSNLPDVALSPEAGALAAELLTLRTAREAEERIPGAILESAGASWVGLYLPGGKTYQLAAKARQGSGKLPERLENSTARALLADGLDVRGSSPKELRAVPDLTLVAGFRSEFDGEPALALVGPSREGEYDTSDLARIQETVEICGRAWRNVEHLERLRSQVFVDFLTGCYNRRAFEEHLTIELVRARRYERPLSLMLVDLDDFKDVNDGLGHDAGDYVLQRVGETLRAAFRTTDRVCRFGGDEFAVIFPETAKEEVLRLAERLRRQIGSIFPDARNSIPLTASIGVASYPFDGARSEDLVKATDRALYQAKGAGRNRVVSA